LVIAASVGDILDNACLIVHRHDADQQRRHCQREAQDLGIQQSVGLDREDDWIKSLCPQVPHRLKDAFVLRCHCDNPAPLIAVVSGKSGCALNGNVVCLGGA